MNLVMKVLFIILIVEFLFVPEEKYLNKEKGLRINEKIDSLIVNVEDSLGFYPSIYNIYKLSQSFHSYNLQNLQFPLSEFNPHVCH